MTPEYFLVVLYPVRIKYIFFAWNGHKSIKYFSRKNILLSRGSMNRPLLCMWYSNGILLCLEKCFAIIWTMMFEPVSVNVCMRGCRKNQWINSLVDKCSSCRVSFVLFCIQHFCWSEFETTFYSSSPLQLCFKDNANVTHGGSHWKDTKWMNNHFEHKKTGAHRETCQK